MRLPPASSKRGQWTENGETPELTPVYQAGKFRRANLFANARFLRSCSARPFRKVIRVGPKSPSAARLGNSLSAQGWPANVAAPAHRPERCDRPRPQQDVA